MIIPLKKWVMIVTLMIPSSAVLGFEFSGGLPQWDERLFMDKKKRPVTEVVATGHRPPVISSGVHYGSGTPGRPGHGRPGHGHPGPFDAEYNQNALSTDPLDDLDQCSDKVIKAKLSACLSDGIEAASDIYDACNGPSWTPAISANVSISRRALVSLGVDVECPTGPEMNAVCKSDFNIVDIDFPSGPEMNASCAKDYDVNQDKVRAKCQSNASFQDAMCGS